VGTLGELSRNADLLGKLGKPTRRARSPITPRRAVLALPCPPPPREMLSGTAAKASRQSLENGTGAPDAPPRAYRAFRPRGLYGSAKSPPPRRGFGVNPQVEGPWGADVTCARRPDGSAKSPARGT
jgi:hypothetical protein